MTATLQSVLRVSRAVRISLCSSCLRGERNAPIYDTRKHDVWREREMYSESHTGTIRNHFLVDEGRIADLRIKVSPADRVGLPVKPLVTPRGGRRG